VTLSYTINGNSDLNCNCKQVLEALFIFATVWSCGAGLPQQPDAPERQRFDAFLKNLIGLGTVDADVLPSSQLPARSLYEYCFDVSSGSWRAWREGVGEYTPKPGGQFARILVPTVDTVR